MSKFVFSLFSIVLSQLIDTLLLHFYFVEGWVKLICWVDFSLTLSHHFGESGYPLLHRQNISELHLVY